MLYHFKTISYHIILSSPEPRRRLVDAGLLLAQLADVLYIYIYTHVYTLLSLYIIITIIVIIYAYIHICIRMYMYVLCNIVYVHV